jgi:hypothetical protein
LKSKGKGERVVKERCVRNGKNEMKRIENRSDNADDADDGDDDVMATMT